MEKIVMMGIINLEVMMKTSLALAFMAGTAAALSVYAGDEFPYQYLQNRQTMRFQNHLALDWMEDKDKDEMHDYIPPEEYKREYREDEYPNQYNPNVYQGGYQPHHPNPNDSNPNDGYENQNHPGNPGNYQQQGQNPVNPNPYGDNPYNR